MEEWFIKAKKDGEGVHGSEEWGGGAGGSRKIRGFLYIVLERQSNHILGPFLTWIAHLGQERNTAVFFTFSLGSLSILNTEVRLSRKLFFFHEHLIAWQRYGEGR
jgi:hypothetical protein